MQKFANFAKKSQIMVTGQLCFKFSPIDNNKGWKDLHKKKLKKIKRKSVWTTDRTLTHPKVVSLPSLQAKTFIRVTLPA